MRIFGGILCWIVPDKIIKEVLSEDSLGKDFISNFIATAIFTVLGWRLVSLFTGFTHHSKSIILDFFVASLGPFIAGIIIMSAFTWALSYIYRINKVEIKGQLLQPGFRELFVCHLHGWAILSTVIFIGLVTRNPQFFILMGLVILRTIDIEARIIKNVCSIDLKDAYKVTAFICAIFAGGILIAGIFIKFFG